MGVDFDLETIAGRFKWARAKRGMSQAELATEAGVVPSTIGNLEAGVRDSMRKLTAVARVLRMDATWLAEGGNYDPCLPSARVLSQLDLSAEEIDLIITRRIGGPEVCTLIDSAVAVAKRLIPPALLREA